MSTEYDQFDKHIMNGISCGKVTFSALLDYCAVPEFASIASKPHGLYRALDRRLTSLRGRQLVKCINRSWVLLPSPEEKHAP